MNIVADRYQFRARIIPEFLTVLPLLLLLVTYVGSLLVLGFLSFALFFVFFQGHLSSRQGRKLEKKLKASKKLPLNSDYLLGLYNKDIKNEYVLLLEDAAERSGIESPFLIKDNMERAKKIEQVITWLREHTRDTEKFPAVFDKLCDYGFYRNTLALRKWALGASLLAFFLLLFPTIKFDFDFSDILEDRMLSIKTIWLLLLAIWLFFWTKIISLGELKIANESYLTTLLMATTATEREKKTTVVDFP